MTAMNEMAQAGDEVKRAAAAEWLPAHEYNYEHFRTRHLARDVEGTARARGIAPGEVAPEFALPRVEGGTMRLSELRGQPVLLHFGSFT